MKTAEKMKKIRSLDPKKLEAELQKEMLELDSLRLAVAAKKEDNTSAISKKRKRIAKIQTVINNPVGEINDR